ncbi:MAG TPA: ADOP family duplicated permease [Acidobacteriaceae bacterium]|jgi:predicted permease|nr:ADOP family duplicated permease [Acidobacteriaceae bacterium]
MLDHLRLALRQLHRSPAFATAVVATLALAIGANTAVFSLLDGFILRKLPYPQAERIAALEWHEQNRNGAAVFNDDDRADTDTWRAVNHDVPAVTAAAESESFGDTVGMNLQAGAAEGGAARYVHGARVSAQYFEVLGVEPMMGRGFTAEEDEPGAGKAAVLSNGLWRTVFHADRGILGKTILLKGAPYTVVGVLPAAAQMPHPADVWTPLMPADAHGVCVGFGCHILMRLKPGASWNEVRAQLAHMPPPRNVNLVKENVWYFPSPLSAYAGGAMREQTEALMLAVGFILLIACANLAGLMLARLHRRTPEIATRLALGASRGRILRQLWLENLVLALVGGAAGVALALGLLAAMRLLLPPSMIPIGGFALDGRVLAFAAVVSVAASLLFGALPALETRRVDLRGSMAAGTRTVAGGSGRVRQGLIGAEVALTVVLLAGAGLLVRTLLHLELQPAGFDPHNVLVAKASLDDAGYRDPAAFERLVHESVAAIERIPGVESAAVALSAPYEDFVNDYVTVPEGRQAGFGDACSFTYATPQYFSALRIPLLAGRAFRDSDTATSQAVAVVNNAFGRHFFAEPSPLGRHFQLGKRTYTIVGVVPDVPDQSNVVREAPVGVDPIFYIPDTQVSPQFLALAHQWFQPSWIVRTTGSVSGLREAVGQAMAGVDPGLPFSGFYSMEDLLDQQLQMQRIEVALLGTLAGLALLLSALGIYALVSNLVAQRTREIGIRIALGSTLAQAMRHMAASGMAAAGLGAAVGMAGCFLVLRVMKSALYGVGPYDPLTLAAVPLLLLSIAAAASMLPALRIARIDPAETLRAE